MKDGKREERKKIALYTLTLNTLFCIEYLKSYYFFVLQYLLFLFQEVFT